MENTPLFFKKLSDTSDSIFAKLGPDIRLAAPLGLGKPNQLLNLIYKKAKENPSVHLKIYTALSLALPEVKEDLGRRFFEPFARRHLGDGYPVLEYSKDAIHDRVPENIQVHEFYFQAGTALGSRHLQRHYQSVNYTHAAENVLRAGVNVIVQLIAKRVMDGKTRYSLSCNPDMTLDVVDLYRQTGRKILVVGVVHRDLPFLAGDAEVEPTFFDSITDSDEVRHELFALPRTPISPEDHLIGFYSSLLVRDEGTLQIGIGSLSDAVVSALRLRHQHNSSYLAIRKKLRPVENDHTTVFTTGLYGLTEMLTDGFMHLRESGILKRRVTDETSGAKTYLHGSFILGSKPFYRWLRDMPPDEAHGLRMTRVSKVNDLYDPQETLLRRQRVHPRFFNTTMQVSLVGEAMSETLPNANVVSGVGGQYNFVAMSSELKDSRSVLMLRSYRIDKGGNRASNIVWTPCHVTIPRHLRDIVITEYGVADLKGRTDEECIKAMIQISDSQFQATLVETAKRYGKLSQSYSVPPEYRNNTPENVQSFFEDGEFQKAFLPFPFGSDFTPEEERLALALDALQKDKKKSMLTVLKKAFSSQNDPASYDAELERMGLSAPKSLKERLYKKIVLAYLK